MKNYVVDDFVKTISQFQQQALAELVKQIIIALKTNNYRFENILDALAEYTRSRDDWGEVTQHIQAARVAVLQASARLRGVQEEDELDE